jgi:hypothetical protein
MRWFHPHLNLEEYASSIVCPRCGWSNRSLLSTDWQPDLIGLIEQQHTVFAMRCGNCDLEWQHTLETRVPVDPAELTLMPLMPPVAREPATLEGRVGAAKGMLRGLVANTVRSVQALEDKLTRDELVLILKKVERTNKAMADGDREELETCLMEMEIAATLIGGAMLRV